MNLELTGFCWKDKTEKIKRDFHGRYIKGTDCPTKGWKEKWHHSEETKHKMRISKLAEKNPNWVGDNVSYSALHTFIKLRLPKPNKCPQCGRKKKIDLSNKSNKYKRALDDWEWLCRSCHMKKDGRMLRRKPNGSFCKLTGDTH
jgi:rubredoxin